MIETEYYGSKITVERNEDPKDLNQTIIPAEHVPEPTTSIWEGILGLDEDLDRDSRIDVSIFMCIFVYIHL